MPLAAEYFQTIGLEGGGVQEDGEKLMQEEGGAVTANFTFTDRGRYLTCAILCDPAHGPARQGPSLKCK